MQVSPRKRELLNRSGFINPLIFNGFDYLWILNTSCANCSIKISCNRLSVFNYHSVIFSSQTNPILQDATFKNYSACPDEFYGRTDRKGFYFVYYYHYHYTTFQDTFNFSYFVFDCKDKYDNLDKDTFGICGCDSRSQSSKCQPHKNEANSLLNISFNSIDPNSNFLFSSRYMHALSVVDSTIYVHGGISSIDIGDQVFIRFLDNKWERVPVFSAIQPPCLYGHSMDYNIKNQELVLFGGIICGSSSMKDNGGVVWIFDINSQKWIEYHDVLSRPVIGHSIHVYQNTMYSFFGLSSSSLVPVVQKFNLETLTWMKNISVHSFNIIRGLAYHSSYQHGLEIWIYGGLFINDSSRIYVSNALYTFNLYTEKWKLISQDGPQLYLHDSFIINNTFIVMGGLIIKNSNNQSHVEFSKGIYQYDIAKGYWMLYDKEFSSMGERSFLKSNNTVLIVGGKTSSFKNPITEIHLTKNGFNTRKLKVSELYIPNLLGLFSFHNCSQLNCESCVRNVCAWCALTKSCISRIQLALLYFTGACDSPILYENQCPVKCEDLSNSGCQNCTKLQICGWCEYQNAFVGVGKCVEGNVYGPHNSTNNTQVQKYCRNNGNGNNWSFLQSRCSACNCNGHATCSNAQNEIPKCISCYHNTTGDQCQHCKYGFQGTAINGNKCYPCKCLIDNSAGQCYPNGFCDEFCIEKGRIGKYCNECDVQNNFSKFQDMCVYNCKINLKYKLNEKTDFFNPYIDRVRFLLSDITSHNDVGFKIRCINSYKATVKVELFNKSEDGRVLIRKTNCAFLEKIFPRALFEGTFSYQMLFTVSGFRNSSIPHFQLEILFTQKPYTNLPFIFISLFACLFTAVLLFYTVFKIRQHIRQRNHNYHQLLVMERPFVKISLKIISDVDKSPNLLELNALLDSSSVHQCPLLCVEPCNVKFRKISGQSEESKRNLLTAVITFLFQSPKCTSLPINQNSHYKHSSRILIGSTIARVSKKDRKLLLDLPTKSSSGNNLTVERDLDTSISPSAAEELLVTDV